MKNFEKYKTVQERGKAFEDFCYISGDCRLCKLKDSDFCRFEWLEQEAEPTSEELIKRFAFDLCVRLKTMVKILEQRDLIKKIWAKQEEELAELAKESKPLEEEYEE